MSKIKKQTKRTKTIAPRVLGPAAVVAPPPITRKLDLACGQSPHQGFEGVDIWTGAKHVVNLMKYPWPFEDNSVAELRCSHFMEHIPMIYVDDFGNEVAMGEGREALFRFVDECYRVLVPGGWMEVIVPSARSNRGFQDPTHRRFFVETTFAYFAADWRIVNRLDHYNVKSDFGVTVATTCDTVLNAMHPEASARHLHSFWNSTVDFVARMQAVKPARTNQAKAAIDVPKAIDAPK